MRLFRAVVALAVFVAVTAAPAHPATIGGPGPTLDSAVVDAARTKLGGDDTAGALALLAPYVAAHPGDAAAGRLLGDVYFRVADYPKAEDAWRAVIRANPSDKLTHNRLGALYAAENRIPEAASEFEQSLPLASAYGGLVKAHQRAGDLGAWQGGIEQAVERDPLDANQWALLGHILEFEHNTARALIAYRKVSNMRPNSCPARVDLSNALLEGNDPDAAIAELNTCLAHQPDYYAAVVNVGEAYLEENDYARATTWLDRAFAIDPNGWEALVDRGYVLDHHGDWKGAVTLYKRALAVDPTRPEAYINLGVDYEGQQLYALAEAAYLKGLSIATDDGTLHYLLGKTYDEQGKVALAREQFRAASFAPEYYIAQQARDQLANLSH
jgi:Flp pilus assembly protein TadD